MVKRRIKRPIFFLTMKKPCPLNVGKPVLRYFLKISAKMVVVLTRLLLNTKAKLAKMIGEYLNLMNFFIYPVKS
jgi:hypothetical protein